MKQIYREKKENEVFVCSAIYNFPDLYWVYKERISDWSYELFRSWRSVNFENFDFFIAGPSL